MEFEEYLGLFILALIVLTFLYQAIKEGNKRRAYEKAREEENKAIQEILGGLDIYAEKNNILKILKDELPNAYKCGKRYCDGIILKHSTKNNYSDYYCSKCNNPRKTIKL